MRLHLRRLNYYIRPAKTSLFVSRRDIWYVDHLELLSQYEEDCDHNGALFLCDLNLSLRQLPVKYHGINLLIFTDETEPYERGDFEDLNLLIVHRSGLKQEVCRKIEQAFSAELLKDDLYKTLMSAIVQNSFLENSLLDILTSLAGNPLVVLDSSFKPIMVSDSRYISQMEYGNGNYDLIGTTASGKLNIYVNEHGNRYAMVPIEYHDFIFGFFIMFERNIVLDDEDGEFLHKLSIAPAIEIQKGNFSYVSDSVNTEEFFSKLLAGEIISQRYIDKISDLMGFSKIMQSSHNYIISFLLPSNTARYSTLIKRFLMRDLRRITGSLLCAQKDEYIVMLFCGLPDRPFSHETEQKLDSFLKSHNILAGISTGFPGTANIRTYYTQSTNAIVLFKHVNNGKNIIATQDYPFFDLLITVSGRTMIRSYISHKITALIQYDEKYGTDFSSTLEKYLINCCNIKQTADALFLHRNTLLYRVKKIGDISGLDFSNSEDIFNAMMSLKILNYLSASFSPSKPSANGEKLP